MKNKSKVEPITSDEWYKSLFIEVQEEVPKGYYSADEIAQKVNLSSSHVRSKLSKLVAEEKAHVLKIRKGRKILSYYKLK